MDLHNNNNNNSGEHDDLGASPWPLERGRAATVASYHPLPNQSAHDDQETENSFHFRPLQRTDGDRDSHIQAFVTAGANATFAHAQATATANGAGGVPSASPSAKQTPPLSTAARKRLWQQEAARLSLRVRELEMENASLRLHSTTPTARDQNASRLSASGSSGSSTPSGVAFNRPVRSPSPFQRSSSQSNLREQETSTAAGGTATMTNAPPPPPPMRISKSSSFMSHGGYTVAEAAAASHRSRTKRQMQPTLRKYRSGYWNGENNVTSSFSCNNLAEMEHRMHAATMNRSPSPQGRFPRRVPEACANGMETMNAPRLLAAAHGIASVPKPNGTRGANQGKALFSETTAHLSPNNNNNNSNAQRGRPSPRRSAATNTAFEEDSNATASLMTKSPGSLSPRSDSSSENRSSLMQKSRSFRSIGSSNNSPTNTHHKKSSHDIRMWVGTWNIGASDPFADNSGIIDEQRFTLMLHNFVPHGYQLYVLGVQEGVSENVYHAVLAYLNRNELGSQYLRLELKNADFTVKNRSYQGETVFDAVRGRGDGAFVGTKFTGIAVFYSISIKPRLDLIRAGVHKFNLTSGSKGGVAVALNLDQTSIVFVNCHLDARNDTYRREQIRTLNSNLGRIMGHHSFDLTEQFHHVVWMGDMNYRIVMLDPPTVLHMIEEGRNLELHDKFDGLINDRRNNGGVFENFLEPNKFPDFYPTYKKFPNRGEVDESIRSWPSLVYRVLYKEPFYKGGKVKKRVPGWCDRILIHSLVVSDSKLLPEKVPSPCVPDARIDNYRSVNHGVGMDVSDHSPVFCTLVLSFPRHDEVLRKSPEQPSKLARSNSRSLSTVTQDYGDNQYKNAVGASYFDQPRVVQRINAVLNRPVSTVLRVFNMQLFWNDNVIVPKRTRVVAPLVGEEPKQKQCDVIGERCQGMNGWNLSLNAVIQHTRSLEQLHMLVWIKHDSISGHCTLSLKRIARQREGEEVKFRVPLYSQSTRLFHEGHPLLLVFSVRSKAFVGN